MHLCYSLWQKSVSLLFTWQHTRPQQPRLEFILQVHQSTHRRLRLWHAAFSFITYRTDRPPMINSRCCKHKLAGFMRTGNQITNIHWIIKKAREFQKIIYFCFIDYTKAFDCVDTTNCGKFWKRWEYQTTWPASWEICMQVKKQQLELDMEQ